MKIRTPSRKVYLEHLNKYGQYSQNKKWNEWYAGVAGLKGKRVARTLLNYKDKSVKVMDLGCGIGLTLTVLGQVFPNSVGVDVFNKEIKATKEILKKTGVGAKVVKYDGKKLPFLAKSFDVVTSIEVIEHVDDPELMLREIRRVLKPDGILHITTANKLWPIEPHFKLPFLSYLPPEISDWYVRISGRGENYQDIHLPTYGEFRRIVGKYFEVEDITLDVIADYKKYGLDEERGAMIVWVSWVIKIFRKIPFIEAMLLWTSLGWLFIARPKNEKN